MNLTVNIEVRLDSGTKLTLTTQQEAQVTSYVKTLVLGERKPRVVRTRQRGYHNWSIEQLKALKDAINSTQPNSKQRGRELRNLAASTGRTLKAVEAKAHWVKQGLVAQNKPLPAEVLGVKLPYNFLGT